MSTCGSHNALTILPDERPECVEPLEVAIRPVADGVA